MCQLEAIGGFGGSQRRSVDAVGLDVIAGLSRVRIVGALRRIPTGTVCPPIHLKGIFLDFRMPQWFFCGQAPLQRLVGKATVHEVWAWCAGGVSWAIGGRSIACFTMPVARFGLT